VNVTPSNYAELRFHPEPNSYPSFISIASGRVNSTSDRFKLKIAPTLITQIGNYQVQVTIENDQGKRGPYIVNITFVNTPPKFIGKTELKEIGKVVEVRLNEKYVDDLPYILNLEKQPLTLSLSDNKTGYTYPFITVSMPHLSFLTFEPTDK
jgi:hypothetical protein